MPEEPKEPHPVSPEVEKPPVAQPTAAGNPAEGAAKPAEGGPLASAALASPATPAANPEGPRPDAAAKPAATAAKPAPAPPKPEAPKPEPWNSELVQSLKAQYGSGIREASTYLGQHYLAVDSTLIREILLRLRDERFDYCVDLTAVHYPKREAQFDIVYILYSFELNQRIRIKTQIKDGEPMRSACSIWPTANWLEREVFDMFGIVFEGHPDLKRILMPDGWKGYPLRKDYPILQQDQEWVKANIGIESGQ